MKTADVVVVGAGLLGMATAYWLAKLGAKVVVLDKGMAGWEASGRATGFLSLRGETPNESKLAAAAETLWNSLDDELGYVTEWCPKGRMWAALPEELDSMRELFELFQTKTTFPFSWIDGAEARELLPYLSDKVAGAIYINRSGHANPQRTSQAFYWACKDLGVEIIENSPVVGIDSSGGKITNVKTHFLDISTPIVVNCAGPQAGLIAQMIEAVVPVGAVKLEAMVSAPVPPMFDLALVGNGMSVRQTKRGNLHFNGGPYEWIDVDLESEPAKPSTASVRNQVNRLIELIPAASNIPLLRCWAGVIDLTPDHNMIIDRVPSAIDGMFVALSSGHGFGLAPAIGKAMAELTLNGESSIPIEGLNLSRFTGLPKDWRKKFHWEAGEINT